MATLPHQCRPRQVPSTHLLLLSLLLLRLLLLLLLGLLLNCRRPTEIHLPIQASLLPHDTKLLLLLLLLNLVHPGHRWGPLKALLELVTRHGVDILGLLDQWLRLLLLVGFWRVIQSNAGGLLLLLLRLRERDVGKGREGRGRDLRGLRGESWR